MGKYDALEGYSPDTYADLAAYGEPESPDETALRESFLKPGRKQDRIGRANQQFREGREGMRDLKAQTDAGPQEYGNFLSGQLGSAADRFTLGGYGGLMRLGRALGVPTTGQAVDDIERYRRTAPDVIQSATEAPTLIEGPANLLTQAASRAVGRGISAIPHGAEALESLPGRIFQGAATTGGTSAAMSGLQASSEGASPGEALNAAREGGETGLAVGGALGLGAGAGGGLGRSIENSRGGQARQFIERRGGSVGPFGGVKLAGEYDVPLNETPTDASIGEQGSASARRGLNMLNTEDRAIKGAIGRGMERTYASPEGSQLRDVTGLVTRLQDATETVGLDPAVRAALRDEVSNITRQQGGDFNPEVDNYFLNEGDLNRLRQLTDRYAKTGVSNAGGLAPLKAAADATREMVNEGPFAEQNAQYARQSRQNRIDRRLLGIPETQRAPNALVDEEGVTGSGDSRTAEDTVKNRITRRGQETVTAGGQRRDMERFAARHPDVAAEFDKPELLRKKADISFRLVPEHGGLIERAGGGMTKAAHLYHAARHPFATAVSLLPTNMAAIQARLLYGPALAAQAAAPMMLGDIPLLAAARAAQSEGR